MLYTSKYVYLGHTLSHCEAGVAVYVNESVPVVYCDGWLAAEAHVDQKLLNAVKLVSEIGLK